MLGTKRRIVERGHRIPEARVVLGGHAPAWASEHRRQPKNSSTALTYERIREGREGALAMVFGFWPLLTIMGMGIALIWSASVSAGP